MSDPEVLLPRSYSDFKSLPFVVGVGASAGGLKALEQFFENMTQDSGVAFVVIQHLSPDFKSLMDELLGRRTEMGIYKVEDGMWVKPNSIYLIPPGQNLVIEKHQLRLSPQQRSNGHPLNFPIDIFFQSLANEYAERSIGVVLSGTGSDGTRGLKDIHQAGGITLVQDPETAEFDGMPQSAIATGIVDQCAPPADLAQIIDQLLQFPIDVQQFRAETSLLRDKAEKLQKIISILALNNQFDFSSYKLNTLSRRIQRRCVVAGFTNLDNYIQRLEHSPDEQALLQNDLLISVTHFFRDLPAWEFIEHKVLPNLVKKTPEHTPIRIWITACATGEEAYTMAILLHEAIERSGRVLEAKIFATDVHSVSLEKAAQGIYPESIANDINEERLQKYFAHKNQSFEVSRKLREMLIFAPHNLVRDACFTRMDLVSCRNVLIYMEPVLQQKVLRHLHFSLNVQGTLFLGASETLAELDEEFTPLNKRHKIYQKLRDVRLPLSVQGASQVAVPVSRRPTHSGGGPRLDPMLNDAFKSFLGEHCVTCLILDMDHNLIHVCGDPLNLLQVPEGPVTRELIKMVPAPLQLPLSTALHRAQRQQQIVEYKGLQIAWGEAKQNINLKVHYRKKNAQIGKPFLMVEISATEQEQFISEAQNFEPDTEATQRIMQMEHELKQTRENLQATIEELETTNEEQQATNEEMVASNEELQSTNEELHAVNEELYTINAEYQSKIQELTELNNDIDNLLSSIDIGVIFLDPDLKIRKFTPAVNQVLHLVDADVGRSLAHFSHNLDYPDLIETLTIVMEKDTCLEHEVRVNPGGAHLLMRMHPYRLSNQRPQGVILTFINITTIKQTQEQLQQEIAVRQSAEATLKTLNETLELQVEERVAELKITNNQLIQEIVKRKQIQKEIDEFFNLSLNPLCIADIDGYFKRINPSFGEILGYSTVEILEKPFVELVHPDDVQTTLTEIEKSAQGGVSVYFENRYCCKDGSYRWLSWASHPSVNNKLYMTGIDITELKKVQASLDQKNAEMAAIFRAMPDAVVFANPDRQIQMVNLAFNRLFGYDNVSIIGKLTQLLYADPQDYFNQTDIRFNPDTDEKLKSYEIRYLHQDGTIFPGEAVATTVQDRQGNTLGSLVVVRDIRARKEIERQINRQLSAIESVQVGIAILDSDRYVYVNQAHAQLFGYRDSKELIGVLWQNLYAPEQYQWIEKEVFPTLQQDGYWSGEVKAIRQDGALFDEEITLTLMPTGELICVCQEITQRKELESFQESMMDALTRSNKDLEQFAYVASHDLREPLRKIKSFSELLVEGYRDKLDETAQKYMDFMTSGVVRMESLIQDLLTYSRLNQDTKTLVPVDLNMTVQTVLDDLQILIEETQATVMIPELPTVTAHPTSMQQLFLNLIGNAIKFQGQSPPQIQITATQFSQEWQIAVQDNGIGIAPEFKERVFEIFQRLHSRADYQGTGIGLALCRKIIQNCGGRIWIESEVGQGSTFFFTLPFETPDQSLPR